MQPVDLKTDGHIHTRLCNHASGELEEYIRAAIDKKLNTIIFLEHLETGIHYFERTWLTDADFDFYFREGEKLKKQYADRITVKLGLEVGFNPLAVDTLQQLVNRYPWEHIGLSYHFYPSGGRHLNMVSRREENLKALASMGPAKIVTDYFEGLIQAIQLLDCDVLCHLDAVMRHYPGISLEPPHWRQIDRILSLLEEKNIHLEVNTSGYAIRNEPYPSLRILKKAAARNISLVAGSDAHRPDQVGRYFDRLPALFLLLGQPVHTNSPDDIKPAT